MSGIYIHIPFCRLKCSYCDFYSIASTAYLEPTLRTIDKELYDKKDFFKGRTIDTIYIGGGTPSTLNPSQLLVIFKTIDKLWDLSSLGEVTLEANPDDVSLDYLKQLKDTTPINRLSMGVQSFDDDLLKLMRRRHDAVQAVRAFEDARKVGFDNISLDLIYGIPTMTQTQWRDSLERMLELSPEHISAYHLSIEQGTRFAKMMQRGEISPVDDSVSQRDYELLCGLLAQGGYEHYEISNFAKPGFRARHNSSYWQGEPYLGVGASAHSFDGNKRHWCEQSVKQYIDKIEYQSEVLTPEDRLNEFFMLSLRQKDGVNIATLRDRFGLGEAERFAKLSKKFIMQGVMQRNGDLVSITEQNWLISDNIISNFFA